LDTGKGIEEVGNAMRAVEPFVAGWTTGLYQIIEAAKERRVRQRHRRSGRIEEATVCIKRRR
jgi:hypothetical protein